MHYSEIEDHGGLLARHITRWRRQSPSLLLQHIMLRFQKGQEENGQTIDISLTTKIEVRDLLIIRQVALTPDVISNLTW